MRYLKNKEIGGRKFRGKFQSPYLSFSKIRWKHYLKIHGKGKRTEVDMERKVYKAKTLIAGHRVDKKFRGMKLVAVPMEMVWKNPELYVRYGDKVMKLQGDPLHMLPFEDKFARNKIYTLGYYEWKPERVSW